MIHPIASHFVSFYDPLSLLPSRWSVWESVFYHLSPLLSLSKPTALMPPKQLAQILTDFQSFKYVNKAFRISSNTWIKARNIYPRGGPRGVCSFVCIWLISDSKSVLLVLGENSSSYLEDPSYHITSLAILEQANKHFKDDQSVLGRISNASLRIIGTFIKQSKLDLVRTKKPFF